MPRQDPQGSEDAPAVRIDLEDVARRRADALRRGRARVRGVVPGELRVGPWQFLQPRVAGELAVARRRVGAKCERDCLRPHRRPECCRARAHCESGTRGARDDAFAQRAAPELVEIRLLRVRPPPIANHVAHRQRRDREQHRDELVGRQSVMQWRDERLHQARGAVMPARIAPLLEEMGLRHMPGACLRCFVLFQREVQRERNAPHEIPELEIDGCVIGGIATQDAQHPDASAAQVLDKLPQRVAAAHVACHRLDVGDGVPGGAQLRVEGVHERMGWRRQAFPGDDERSTAAAPQLARDRDGRHLARSLAARS